MKKINVPLKISKKFPPPQKKKKKTESPFKTQKNNQITSSISFESLVSNQPHHLTSNLNFLHTKTGPLLIHLNQIGQKTVNFRKIYKRTQITQPEDNLHVVPASKLL